jgi:hypothetical protein
MEKGFYCLVMLNIFSIIHSAGALIGKKERLLIDCWIKENKLNSYGDPSDTVYTGGTPLFNEVTGAHLEQHEYIYQKYPDHPWDTALARLALKSLQGGEKAAEKMIVAYVKNNSLDDIAHTIQYLNYYKSWYQSVRPAPVSLQEKLSPESHYLINYFKTFATQHFTLKSDRFLPGARKLTCFGDAYFGFVSSRLAKHFVHKVVFTVREKLAPYLKDIELEDVEKLNQYLTFYRSWYQSVTPPPHELTKDLSEEAKEMIRIIKETADTYFKQKPPQNISGASRLSLAGALYYDKITAWLIQQEERKRRNALGVQRMMVREP